METNLINHNGRLISESDLDLQSSNRSFRYGDGLFETIKIINNHPLSLPKHYSRLVRGMASLALEITENFTLEFFNQQIQAILPKESSHGVIRFMVYRSGKGNYLPESNSFEFLIEFFPNPSQQTYFSETANRYKLGCFQEVKKQASPISFFKSNNAQIYILAAIHAKKMKLDNVCLFNSDGHIIETISENIFGYKNGTVYTPPISSGPVEGTMRAVIKKILKWNTIDCKEECLELEDWKEMEEIFLTNSIKGIIPVTQFMDKDLSSSYSTGLRMKLEARIEEMSRKGL